jgi:acyl carrier protein
VQALAFRALGSEIDVGRCRFPRAVVRGLQDTEQQQHYLMDPKPFLTNMEELLECDPGSLSLDQTLASTGKWDSLNFVSFLAMAHAKYGVKVAPANLMACKTIADAMILVCPM